LQKNVEANQFSLRERLLNHHKEHWVDPDRKNSCGFVAKIGQMRKQVSMTKRTLTILPFFGSERASVPSLVQGIRGNESDPDEEAEGIGERECPAEEAGSRSLPGQLDFSGDGTGKLISPARRATSLNKSNKVSVIAYMFH
jgi:hypothetical protein